MHVRNHVVAAVAALALLGAATACGGSDTTATTPAAKSPAAVIDQQNMAFIPAQVTVKVGDTILIKNSEAALHTGNINDKNVTGTMKQGAEVLWTATAAGTYQVTCDFHPNMHAKIVVQ
jgi:plastocyanin